MTALPPSSAMVPPPAAAPRNAGTRRRTGMALALLTGAAVLGAYAVYTFRQVESIEPTVLLSPITDPKELAARQHDVIGTFATGNAPGDRTLIVHPDGKVEFIEIGADPATGRTTDSYQLGRCGKELCLGTVHSGVIEIVNIDTLVYDRDTYRRPR